MTIPISISIKKPALSFKKRDWILDEFFHKFTVSISGL